MPNFLSPANGAPADEVDEGFPGPAAEVSGSTDNGVGASYGPGNPANFTPSISGALGIGGLGRGSKPVALHTEYAESDADWAKAYPGGADVVFYLMRADQ